MARHCANQGRLSEALEWCEKAIAADKLNPVHHYLNATIMQEQGLHDNAIQSLIRALYLEPRFVLAHFALGKLHQSQGCYREAQRYFGNVLLLLRKHPPDETLPEADGLTAGRLVEIVTSLLASLPQPATATHKAKNLNSSHRDHREHRDEASSTYFSYSPDGWDCY